MENKIQISTLGGCILRDIFRVADEEERFAMKGNVGFVSPLAINSKKSDNIRLVDQIEERLDKCEDSNFHKRNKKLDLEKGVWDFFKENKSEYLLMDLTDLMYPLLVKGEYVYTCRNSDYESEKVFKKALMSLGFAYRNVSGYTAEFVLDAIAAMCRKVLEIWDSEKIILLNAYPVNHLMTLDGIDENHQYLRGVYEHGSYWYLQKRAYKKAGEILKCRCLYMPPLQYVTALQNHEWGVHPFHYTDSIYRFLYSRLCEMFSVEGEVPSSCRLGEIKQEYYRNLKSPRFADCAMSELCIDLIAETNILEYLMALRRLRRCLVVIAIKDTAGAYLDGAIQNALFRLGLGESLVKRFGVGYIGVIRDCVPVFEKISDKNSSLDEVLQVDFLSLNIVSRSFMDGNEARICINGTDWACNLRGLNIVVYDYATRSVVDSVSFDTHSPGRECCRKSNLIDKEDLIRVEIKKAARSNV